jgi:hypothetical protein
VDWRSGTPADPQRAPFETGPAGRLRFDADIAANAQFSIGSTWQASPKDHVAAPLRPHATTITGPARTRIVLDAIFRSSHAVKAPARPTCQTSGLRSFR